jgi:hypothetical protein
VIYSLDRPAAARARGRVQVGREFFARYLRKLGRFSGHSSPRPLKRRIESMRLANSLIPNYSGSDLGFSSVEVPFLSL